MRAFFSQVWAEEGRAGSHPATPAVPTQSVPERPAAPRGGSRLWEGWRLWEGAWAPVLAFQARGAVPLREQEGTSYFPPCGVHGEEAPADTAPHHAYGQAFPGPEAGRGRGLQAAGQVWGQELAPGSQRPWQRAGCPGRGGELGAAGGQS